MSNLGKSVSFFSSFLSRSAAWYTDSRNRLMPCRKEFSSYKILMLAYRTDWKNYRIKSTTWTKISIQILPSGDF